MKYIKFIFICIFLTTQYALPQHFAKYAGEFLSIGVGGRALAVGGAYSALANDVSAIYWNPAALMRINYPEIMIMHDEQFGGMMNYDFAGTAIPSSEDATIGFSLTRLGIDGIPNTINALDDRNGNGILDSADYIDPNRVSYFNAADWVFTFSYSKSVSSKLMYGVNLKLLHRSILNSTAKGIGFDAGILYSPKDNWFIALSAKDITTTLIAWSHGTNELVTPTLKLGTTYYVSIFNGILAPAFDVDIRFENRRTASIANLGPISFDPHLGLEFDYKKSIALRLGYNDIKQLALGAGVHLRKIDIDYSFAKLNKENDLGDTHRISLRLILESENNLRPQK